MGERREVREETRGDWRVCSNSYTKPAAQRAPPMVRAEKTHYSSSPGSGPTARSQPLTPSAVGSQVYCAATAERAERATAERSIGGPRQRQLGKRPIDPDLGLSRLRRGSLAERDGLHSSF